LTTDTTLPRRTSRKQKRGINMAFGVFHRRFRNRGIVGGTNRTKSEQ
jgi:hypothetical protein